MSTTAVALFVLGLATIAQFVLFVFLLSVGTRWARIEGATIRRAVLATFLIYAANLVAATTALLWRPMSAFLEIFIAFSSFAACLLLPPLLIRTIYRATWPKSLLAWLPTWLSPVLGLLLVLFVVRPFLFEAFTPSGNSMAPTLLATHFTVTCPQCGTPAYGTLSPHNLPGREVLAICDKFHVSPTNPATTESDGDKFMVAKYLRPRRWDLVVFRFPSDPKIIYVKRLVGLPGEKVYIKDGAVWIDDQKLEPPSALNGVNYVTELPVVPGFPLPAPELAVAGTLDHPAVLGPGEYFMLGDFSPQSADSRLWKKGAPGHPPYAVPESYVIGVATHIYWPPSRWRILR